MPVTQPQEVLTVYAKVVRLKLGLIHFRKTEDISQYMEGVHWFCLGRQDNLKWGRG